MSKLQWHWTRLWEIWITYQQKHCAQTFKNTTKFWKSEKTEILVFRISKTSIWYRKKSLNRLDRFQVIGQRVRVVPSRISNLKGKRGQYQDYGFVRAKRQRNVASKRRYLWNVWKEPCRGCGFVTFVTFLRFFEILGFAKKTKKNTHRVTKT